MTSDRRPRNPQPTKSAVLQGTIVPVTELQDADLETMITIRLFEKRLLDLFSQGLVNGTTHTCVGQEYVPVSLRTLCTDRDFVFSNHRGHGHYLTQFDDPEGLLAELLGKDGAICCGVGGSQHLFREDAFLSTGVLGENVPAAAGVALKFKRDGDQRIAFVYLGDGAWGQGGVYEALNIAKLWSLPLVVITENNDIAQSTPRRENMSGSIEGRAFGIDLDYQKVTSTDINTIRRQLGPAVERVRQGAGPLVVEFATHRLGPHSKGDDTRAADELAEIARNDWWPTYKAVFPNQTAEIETRATKRLDAVFADVAARPPSALVPK